MADNFLVDALDEALKMFGTYSYYDKGVDEIMFAGEHITTLKSMGADEVIGITEELLEHEHGEPFYAFIYEELVEDQNHPEAEELHQRMYNPHIDIEYSPIEVEGMTFGEVLKAKLYPNEE